MRINAEVTIDLDEKRRVWSQADAEGVAVEQIEGVAGALCRAAADGAKAAYDHALDRNPALGKSKDGKDPLATFGDD